MSVLVEYPGLEFGVPRWLSIHPDHIEIRESRGGCRIVNAMWFGHIQRVSVRMVAGLAFLDVRDRNGGLLSMPMRGRIDAIASKNIISVLVREHRMEDAARPSAGAVGAGTGASSIRTAT